MLPFVYRIVDVAVYQLYRAVWKLESYSVLETFGHLEIAIRFSEWILVWTNSEILVWMYLDIKKEIKNKERANQQIIPKIEL